MCGISGIYKLNGENVSHIEIEWINNKLIHRGPDNGNVYIHSSVGLGQRRLSIIDLSKEANQPFVFKNRYIISYNGEVYNFKELKCELEIKGVEFTTASDTEVVVASYMYWGNEAFKKLNGMFALAIYDCQTEDLIVARDRFGIKPMYYYKSESYFIFASEMKAILAYPNIGFSISKNALTEYLWYGNPLGNNTFYKEIFELEPGCHISISRKIFKKEKYYNINETKEIKINEEEAIFKIKKGLENSIKRHLISDVPVGVFLSGGIDSSAITAYSSKFYHGTINTYSVGFDFINGPNELEKAKRIAKLFGTNHNEITINGTDLPNIIEALVEAHDEPFADAADIPLYLLTQQLKGDIKVVLQGDGGDEFFGGYPLYKMMYYSSHISKFSFIAKWIGILKSNNSYLLRVQRILDSMGLNDAMRFAMLSTMDTKKSRPLGILNPIIQNQLNNSNPFYRFEELFSDFPTNLSKLQQVFYAESQIILKDTFLEKVDKSTMANAIEVRVPFLDNELTELMLSIPAELKVKNGVQKYLLKKALVGLIPNDILFGKKTGFSVPYGYWLKTSLKSFFLEQISTRRVSTFLDVPHLKILLNNHINNRGNFQYLLWKSLILAIWLNKNTNLEIE